MVHQHFLTGGQVEVLAGQRLDQMPAQALLALEGRHHRDAPAFFGVAVFGRGTHRESGHLLEVDVAAGSDGLLRVAESSPARPSLSVTPSVNDVRSK